MHNKSLQGEKIGLGGKTWSYWENH